ncbi:hypothetical protein HZA85_00520 [Candidatus Uhrbacteria bacterium]|nr:hypothetical protein [Candidatus Uhrbacteria bacterium]
MMQRILVLCVPLALAMGCGTDDQAARDLANCQKKGGCGADAGDNTNQSGLVLATAPNDLTGKPLVGDFYFDENLACSSVSTCEASVTGVVTVQIRCPKHLILPKTATGDPKKTTTVVWNQPGDWGLAPKGLYRFGNGTYEVETKIGDKGVKMVVYGLWDDGVLVHGSNLVYYNGKDSGNISDDLKTITLIGLDPNDIFVLTLVE